MSILNIEIKASCSNPASIKTILEKKNARFMGIDHQVDTYFKANDGRLKLREGNIENTLIHYLRPNQAGPKPSQVSLYHPEPNAALKVVLSKAMGVLAVVDKERAIYFLNNVKFHIDEVKGLGSFVEIEAIDKDGSIGQEKLLEQCNFYLDLFGIGDGDLIDRSYSDMVMEKGI